MNQIEISNEEKSQNSLNRIIEKYKENKNLLFELQRRTEKAFNQITNILKPTTSDLLKCVNIDNLINVALDLGASKKRQTLVLNEKERMKEVKLDNPAIAIVGQSKSGKSTFVNALLQKNVEQQIIYNLKSHLTRFTFSKKNYCKVMDSNGIIKTSEISDNISTNTCSHKIEENGTILKTGIKSSFLEYGIDIIDSPGLCEDAILATLTKNMIKKLSPIMIYVIDGRKSVTQTDISDILDLKNSIPNCQIIYFITKLDQKDPLEIEINDQIRFAKLKMEKAFKKLQFYNLIPASYSHWSHCKYFHGASLKTYINYYKDIKTPVTNFHFTQYKKFEATLQYFLSVSFENKIQKATDTVIGFQSDVLTKILSRAKILSDFSKENLNQIFLIRKIEEKLYKSIKSVINESKTDLIDRLALRLENQLNIIIDPILEMDYPKLSNIPNNGIVNDNSIIIKCEECIMYWICQGMDNIVETFVEEELFEKYQQAIEYHISDRMKNKMELHKRENITKSPYRSSLERILTDKYKINFNKYEDKIKMKKNISNGIKIFLQGHLQMDKTNGKVIDVKSSKWKMETAKEYINYCDKFQLAEMICQNLFRDLENRHNIFLLALEWEHNFVQKKIVMSENIRKEIAAKVPDFSLLLMLTLDIKSRYVMKYVQEKERIGYGAQGVVYRCVCDGKEYAKKVVILPADYLETISEEIYYSYLFQHPRLLPMVAVSVDDDGEYERKRISIYTPLMKTDLHQFLKENVTTFEDRMIIGLQVAKALQYLHSQNIMHRDLKLSNILLDSNNNVFLADYGFCKSIALTSHTFVGTPVHIAPEIITQEMYDYKVDIYSFGILLWYLLEGTGKHPIFVEIQSNRSNLFFLAVHENIRPERIPNTPDELWDLMNSCWTKNPLIRPEIEQVIERIQKLLNKLT